MRDLSCVWCTSDCIWMLAVSSGANIWQWVSYEAIDWSIPYHSSTAVRLLTPKSLKIGSLVIYIILTSSGKKYIKVKINCFKSLFRNTPSTSIHRNLFNRKMFNKNMSIHLGTTSRRHGLAGIHNKQHYIGKYISLHTL